jgi:hypothetical protein
MALTSPEIEKKAPFSCITYKSYKQSTQSGNDTLWLPANASKGDLNTSLSALKLPFFSNLIYLIAWPGVGLR